tara:strand:- start:355 stop:1023 length:669 start_codon:yes stop_codon:yes gene_type:complete
MIFLTADERPYKKGNFILSHGVKYLPTAPSTTYIVFESKITEKTIKEWIDVVAFRLVFVIDKLPKLSKEIKERIIIDKSLNTNDGGVNRAINSMFKYGDRQFVYQTLKATNTPIPLALAWMKANYDSDIQKWRRMAEVMFTLPDTYAYAIMAFCIKGTGKNPIYPKKKDTRIILPPDYPFRDSDKYGIMLLNKLADIRNDLRIEQPEQNLITKRLEPTVSWL